MSVTPSFIGVQPAVYDSEDNEVKPLGTIESDAYELVTAFDGSQQSEAVLGDTLIDLVLGPGTDGRTIEAQGISGADMTDAQKELLLTLISHYGNLVNEEDAAVRMAELESEIDQTYFAWYSPTDPADTSGIYFRVTGPSIVIEYSGQQMGGNATDHIHGIYRDPHQRLRRRVRRWSVVTLRRAGRATAILSLVAVASLCALAGTASAHSLASSSVTIEETDAGLIGTISLAVGSLDRAFDAEHRCDTLSPGEYATQVVAYLDDHLEIRGTDGTLWPESYSNLERQTAEGIETISVDLAADIGATDRADFTVSYDAIIEAVPDHEAVLVVVNAANQASTPGVFTVDTSSIDVGDGSSGVAMLDMARFGFHHVLDGADHLLFLLTLLLPAPLIAVAGRWRRGPGLRPAVHKVVHVVTAFTIGHSVTLVATALGWITVPGRPVETLIAVSVAVSAVHAIRPIICGGEPVIAGIFGLIHGMAFAGILTQLGLNGSTSLLALLAFNIGIEIAQLTADDLPQIVCHRILQQTLASQRPTGWSGGQTSVMADRMTSVGGRNGACYWCGKPADSREDIIPKWLDNVLIIPATLTAGRRRLRTRQGDAERTTTAQRWATRSATTKSVCENCNNTWMAGIEEPTKPLLAPMILGEATTLDLQAQLQIAQWATMKAALVDSRPDRAAEGLASEAIRDAIYEHRQPPADMVVRVAAFNEPFQVMITHPHAIGTGQSGQYLAQWATTLVFGHFVVQIAGRTGARKRGVLNEFPSGVRAGSSFSVWPPQPTTVAWPPGQILDRDELAVFMAQMVQGTDPLTSEFEDPAECLHCGDQHGLLTRDLPKPPGADAAIGLSWAGPALACGAA